MRRRLVSAATVGAALSWLAGPALGQTAVKVQDSTYMNTQAVDGSHNAAVAANATSGGGAAKLCSGQIAPTTPPASANQVTCPPSGGAHQVYTYALDNTQNTTPVWFQLFDQNSVVLGTNIASGQIEVPPGGTVIIPISVGDQFIRSIIFACTTTSTGSASPKNACGYTLWGL